MCKVLNEIYLMIIVLTNVAVFNIGDRSSLIIVIIPNVKLKNYVVDDGVSFTLRLCRRYIAYII